MAFIHIIQYYIFLAKCAYDSEYFKQWANFILNRLFVQPLYCGVLLEQSLMLNRRRDDRDRDFRLGSEKVLNRLLRLSVIWRYNTFFVSLNKWLTIDKLTYSINVLDLSRPR